MLGYKGGANRCEWGCGWAYVWEDARVTEYPRALTDIERSMLEYLLSENFPGAVEYRSQAAGAVVTERCPCGCLDIDLAVSPDDLSADDAGYWIRAWSETQQVSLALDTVAGRLVGVRMMWFGNEEHRLDPDFSTFEIELIAPEDRRPVRPSWQRRIRALLLGRHTQHRRMSRH